MLFGVDRSVITKYLKNIFDTAELDKNSTCAKFAQVRNEGFRSVNREIEFYNLDAIISVFKRKAVVSFFILALPLEDSHPYIL